MRQQQLIHAFKQTRTKLFVYVQSTINYYPTDLILVHLSVFVALCEILQPRS